MTVKKIKTAVCEISCSTNSPKPKVAVSFSMFVIDFGFEKLSHSVAKKVHQNNNSANNSNNSANTGIE